MNSLNVRPGLCSWLLRLHAGDDDWRLAGQETHLSGTVWTRKRYRVRSDTWEHDHCAFCWATVMDPDFSPAARAALEEDPSILAEGYATTVEHPHGADYHWVCDKCFKDFSTRSGWRVVE
jgi:hypothetical protein